MRAASIHRESGARNVAASDRTVSESEKITAVLQSKTRQGRRGLNPRSGAPSNVPVRNDGYTNTTRTKAGWNSTLNAHPASVQASPKPTPGPPPSAPRARQRSGRHILKFGSTALRHPGETTSGSPGSLGVGNKRKNAKGDLNMPRSHGASHAWLTTQ